MSMILEIPTSDNRLDLDNWKSVVDELHSTYGNDVIPQGMAVSLVQDVKDAIDHLPRHYVGIQDDEIIQILQYLERVWG